MQDQFIHKQNKFTELGITNSELLANLTKHGFLEPTEIQTRAIPLILQGFDILGKAQTGTGKTAAFCLPLLQTYTTAKSKVLILSPTRELALQIYNSIKLFSPHMPLACLYGGQGYTKQIKDLKNAAFIVGTPGRVLDLIKQEYVDLGSCQTLVLDEADQMLDMGFIHDIKFVFSKLKSDCQKLLFSATVSSSIKSIVHKYLSNYKTVDISPSQDATSNVEQYYAIVPPHLTTEALSRLIMVENPKSALLFVKTKKDTVILAQKIKVQGKSIGFINGDLEQKQREFVIKRFMEQKIQCLVATDVVARGIDIRHITHVINLSIPEDLDTYVHRIGRTGRYKSKGKSIVFVSPYELRRLKTLERFIHCKLKQMNIPTAKEVYKARIVKLEEHIKRTIEQERIPQIHDLQNMISSSIQADKDDIIYALLAKINEQEHYSVDEVRELEGKTQFSLSDHKHPYTMRIKISAGLNQGLTPQLVLKGVIDTLKCRARDIGKISVGARRTTFILKGAHTNWQSGSKISLKNKYYPLISLHHE